MIYFAYLINFFNKFYIEFLQGFFIILFIKHTRLSVLKFQNFLQSWQYFVSIQENRKYLTFLFFCVILPPTLIQLNKIKTNQRKTQLTFWINHHYNWWNTTNPTTAHDTTNTITTTTLNAAPFLYIRLHTKFLKLFVKNQIDHVAA